MKRRSIDVLDKMLSKKRKFNEEYLSATNAKYFYNNDILGYNLKTNSIYTFDNFINYINNKEIVKKETNNDYITQYIYKRGIDFENDIINKISNYAKRNSLKFIDITKGKPDHTKYDEYHKKTNLYIRKNYDIIYQGMIQSNKKSKNKFFGFPDLMVNKKTFKKMFFNYINKDKNFEISLKENFRNYYNYIIIDIKSSSLQLNVDGLTGRNKEIMKQYKCQLAVYGHIMETNYKKKCLTYILPHEIKIEFYNNKEKMDKYFINPYRNKYVLIKVDIYDKDKEYLDSLKNIYYDFIENNNKTIKFLSDNHIEQIKILINNNEKDDIKDLDLNFNNDRPQFLPIVKGNNIENYEIKKWIAIQTKSLTLIRGFNVNDIINLNNLGIYNYLQKNELLKWCLTNKKREYDIIEAILESNNYNEIFCKKLKNKLEEFDKIFDKKYILCMDFETIPNKLFEDIDDIESSQKVFMVGCSIFKNENNKLTHEIDLQYELKNINDNENNIFNEFKKKLKDLDLIENSYFIIWSQFEINVMKNLNIEYKNNKLFGIEIIDLYKIFSENGPIGIKYAFDYSIKSITNAYVKNKLIEKTETWDNNIVNGFNAMYYALLYYKNMNGEYNKNFNDIRKYNKIDCKIMGNIINITYDLLKKKNNV